MVLRHAPLRTRLRTALVFRTLPAASLVAVGAGLLLIAVGAGPASAHAGLVRSSPADQSSLGTAPKTVKLTFDENIRMPAVVLVKDSDGASVVAGKTSVVDNIVSTPVKTGPSGDFTVAYRVVSADGHPVSGRLSFTVGSGTPGAGGAEQSSGPPARVIAMIAALALVGGVGLLTLRRWAPNLWPSS
jgi:methionine-rich copper-binding protein CopC